MVSLDFSSAVYSVVILTSAEKHWGYGFGNSTTPDNPYWRSVIFCYFNSDTGTVRFNVYYKGSSQSFNNLNLQSVTYAFL